MSWNEIIGSTKSHGSNKKLTSGTPIYIARVNSIILDETDEGWNENGGYASVGYIYFNITTIPKKSQKNIARPLFSNQKFYPLKNELVYIIGLPSTNINKDPASVSYYYFQPINIWNSNHHNAIPDEIFSQLPSASRQDYKQTELGISYRQIADEGSDIDLGTTFYERTDIRTLQPYEGDNILEGRWGQSIRFGSTVQNTHVTNSWSSTGTNGDPILIIRNGQYNNNQDPWVPIIENINLDANSAYFTTTQQIYLSASSANYNSYTTAPTAVDQYSNNQIILNSGRLVFNSTNDHVLLSSNKSINLNAVNSVNIDTPLTVIQSNKVFLGDKEATEPLLYGNKTYDLLEKLLKNLQGFMEICSKQVGTSPGTLLEPLTGTATNMKLILNELEQDLQSVRSKTSYTK
jgi:hypothetical protein